MIGSSGGRRWLWLVPATGIVLGDQGAKLWIAGWLPYGASEAVTPFFNLVHVLNEGAAFSLLAGAGGWQRPFFLLVALAVAAGLVVLLLRGVDRWREAAAYSLILGGALGNAVDRAARGAVLDYLDFHLGGWHWPAFNLADSAIVLGVVLFLLGSAASPRKESA
ncbi:MAG: signal peptidase II [Pseudomonadota bacterium]|jgi:signal peptidase II